MIRGADRSHRHNISVARHQHASLSVRFHERERYAGPEMSHGGDELRHTFATGDGLLGRPHDSTTVGVGYNIGDKKAFKSSEISILRSGNELLEKKSLLGGSHRPATPFSNVSSRAADKLPSIVFADLENFRNLLVCVVECLPENVGGSFCRCELFQ